MFLEIKQIKKSFGAGDSRVEVLKGIDLEIERGEFCVLLGPSGSGKSTLMHILGGVDRPDSGSVYMDGQDIYKQNDEQLAIFRRRQVGLIYQFYNLIPVLDAVENMTLPALLDGRKVEKSRIDQMINDLGLKGREHHLPNQLSGGQQQRVSIARALAKNPKMLLCDEPTGALDYVTGKQILKLLQDTCRKQKMTVLVITHNSAIAPMADRVIRIKNGKAASVCTNPSPVSVEDIEW